ncbi:MAG: DUF2393 family protein [Candidatus Aminicenantes bacterium]|nr:DUF2393 family protein [Candidatus Aminicenantes bacterium]MDH5704636.1 DUF2393 family protein [Candidatus Aminicenantes bacterium]
MIPLMSLMIGAYIITRMMIFLLNKNPDQFKLGNIINKVLATITIIITAVCVVLIFSSSTSFLDIEEEIKPDEISLKSKKVESSKKPKEKDIEELEQKQAYIDKIKILNLRVAEAQFGGLGVFGEIKNAGDKTLTEVEITIYFLDKNNKPIFEKTYHPVLVTEFSLGDNKPLKPNYSREFGYKPDDIPSDWAEKVRAKITNIEFE